MDDFQIDHEQQQQQHVGWVQIMMMFCCRTKSVVISGWIYVLLSGFFLYIYTHLFVFFTIFEKETKLFLFIIIISWSRFFYGYEIQCVIESTYIGGFFILIVSSRFVFKRRKTVVFIRIRSFCFSFCCAQLIFLPMAPDTCCYFYSAWLRCVHCLNTYSGEFIRASFSAKTSSDLRNGKLRSRL